MKLQVAIDLLSTADALTLLNKVAEHVDVIEVRLLGHIGLQSHDVAANGGDGLIQYGLTPADNEHGSTFFGDPLGGGQADAFATTGDDSYFAFQRRSHRVLQFCDDRYIIMLNWARQVFCATIIQFFGANVDGTTSCI